MTISCFLDDWLEQKAVTEINYNLFSSIEEPFPKACITLVTQYLTPDALGLHRGRPCPLTIQISEKKKVQLTDFFIDYWKVKGHQYGMIICVYLSYLGDMCQITNVRKSYKDRNAGDIVRESLSNDSYLKKYDKKGIEKSDHSFNSFRVLGQSTVDYIKETVVPNTLIDNSKPYFFIGLNDVANYTSTNKLSKKGNNIKAFVSLADKPTDERDQNSDTENKAVKLGITQKGIDLKKVLTMRSVDYEINCGEKGDIKNLKVKNYVFNPDDFNNFKTVELVTTQPNDKDNSKYPIMDNFLFFTDSTSGKRFSNRPARNAIVEIYNDMSDSISQMFTIHARGCIPTNFEVLKELISAGDQIYVSTLYGYSALNGLYVLKSVEYKFNKNLVGLDLVLTRSFYDMQFPSNKDVLEIDEDPVYPLSPVCNEGELLS